MAMGLPMNKYALVLSVALGCEQVGDLGKHESDTAAGGDGGGNATMCIGEECEDSSPGTGVAEGDGDGGEQMCDEGDCEGPAPGTPSTECPDGTVAGPACLDDGAGGCAWGITECPPFNCTENECGPPPGAANYLCPDGKTMGGPGPCEQLDDGTCGYDFVDCEGCCDPWMAPNTCPDPSCCDDETWSCEGCTTAPGTECLGPTCVEDMGSCAAGEECCDGLMCCQGVPVPVGQEYCSANCPISDRNKKENFTPVDPKTVLAKVAKLEITTWNYTFEDKAIRHLGPMAQDFKASFDLGATDKSIFTVDADGVALAAIQALTAENKALKQRLNRLERRLTRLERKK